MNGDEAVRKSALTFLIKIATTYPEHRKDAVKCMGIAVSCKFTEVRVMALQAMAMFPKEAAGFIRNARELVKDENAEVQKAAAALLLVIEKKK